MTEQEKALMERLRPLVEADREIIDWLVGIALRSGAYLVLADGDVDSDTAYEVTGHVHALAQRLVENHPQAFDRATLLVLSGHDEQHFRDIAPS